ncbi:MAG: aldo/keto reductase [Oscillospiraceae bacterium]|jgi:predicted aldo/keto reductase-like oxidoreductase|nr:aldo/keto reductase [Oscillospiraceae bacterium]
MNYREDKYGNRISVLGYGCMRLPQAGGRIDIPQAEKLIMSAAEAGVNYFDTAYIYPGSEAALGEILERGGIRDKVFIASKLPHYMIKSREGAEKLFNEELKRLRTDHIDYYLMHMLTDTATWERLKGLGIEEWLEEKKKSGAIRQIGFSYHGNSEMFCRLLDVRDWDMCLIQYNYMDENSQAGRRGLRRAHEKGIPVMIMEPLRGGKLANRIPQAALDIFEGHPVKHTAAQWSFRWLFDQPEITCVLSGMNNAEVLADNIGTASEAGAGSLTDEDREMLRRAAEAINAKMKVPCTGCGYCMPCPKNVDIPGTFSAYNRRYSEGWVAAEKDYFMQSAIRHDSTAASNCVGCGKCEKHCPQRIEIRRELKNARAVLEGPVYKIARAAVKLFRIY